MPRNGSGTYSYPSGSEAVTATPASSTSFNTLINDLASALTGSLASDGQTAMTGNLQMGNNQITGLAASAGSDTNAVSRAYLKALTVALNTTKGTDIASATTTSIGGSTANYFNITGTTTITSFGTGQPGTIRVLQFMGILTITHNATTLILPAATNITTAAGDMAIFIAEGSSSWRCVAYQRANGKALVETVSSTPVTSLANATNGGMTVSAATGAVTLTLNPNDLTTLSGAIDNAADFLVISDASASNAPRKVTPNNVMAVVGTAYVESASTTGVTTILPADGTVPQITEGTELLSVAYTMKSTTNRLRFNVNIMCSIGSGANVIGAALFDGATNAIHASGIYVPNTDKQQITLQYEYVPGTTSSKTYSVRIGPNSAGTVTPNGYYGAASVCSMTLTEIRA
jgi:hypothetical protein